MKTKFWFMKIFGFLITIIGFSYCLTSFFNFFEVIFGNKIIVEGANIWLMGVGLIFPLFLFTLGVYFYFYADYVVQDNNKIVLTSIIILFIISIGCIILSIFKENSNLLGLIHPSFGYSLLIIGVLLVYGRLKYKY